MQYNGTARGNRIDLDQSLDLSGGTRVRVIVKPLTHPSPGWPEAILKLAGTLTSAEADEWLRSAESCRQ